MDTHSRDAARSDGQVRYRVDSTGERVAILPATCKLGRHSLSATGYRAIALEGELHISCMACAVDLDADHWRLLTVGPSAERAELDDEPYVEALPRPRSAGNRDS